MDLDQALCIVDSAVFAKTKRHLSDVEGVVLRGAWQGQTYLQMAESSNYSAKYLSQDIGPKFWQLLSESLGERVNKRNFRQALERKLRSQEAEKNLLFLSVPLSDTPQITPDRNFVGREGAIAQLNSLVNQGAKIITICAPGGVGKTTLAWQYLHNHGFDKILEIWMAKEIQNINSVESEVERWLQQDFGEEPGRDFGVNLERLRQKLRDPNQRIGILIDNLEPALDKNGRFIEDRRAYVDFLRVLADPGARSITLITSRERLYEPCIEIKDYRLEGLNEASWYKFFSSHGIKLNSSALKEMHHAYGGNAKAMQLLHSAVQIDFDGDLARFWQENEANLLLNPTLENLVSEQFNRLQVIYPEAYQLLCRLGCFRYQDLPQVSVDAIFCLLWDVADTRKKRIIQDLQARALIEAQDSEYWLHPVIRAEAVKRLMAHGEWKHTNRKAANFWTEIVQRVETPEDAIQALEAYHHYMENDDFERAAEVILQNRANKWEEGESLGHACYRLGLLQKTSVVIKQIIERIANRYHQSVLWNILGDIEWLSGRIHKAIQYHKKSLSLSDGTIKFPQKCELIKYRLERQKLASLFNIGLCKLDLWEIEAAEELFQRTADLARAYIINFSGLDEFEAIPPRLRCEDLEEDCSAYLAFIHSCFGRRKKAFYLIEKSKPLQPRADTWSQGYIPIILGLTYKELKIPEQAFKFFQEAVAYGQESGFVQVKAKALIGLAELQRIQKEIDTSFSYYLESIKLLDTIGARFDLAEAYFQFGLTHQAMGEVEKGLEYRDKAIKLFEEMEAPRQVERVRLAFERTEQK